MMRYLFLAMSLGVMACGNRAVGTTPAPEDEPTVRVWKEDLEDNSNSTLIWAENTGKVSIVVTQLRLYSCTNLYQECGRTCSTLRRSERCVRWRNTWSSSAPEALVRKVAVPSQARGGKLGPWGVAEFRSGLR